MTTSWILRGRYTSPVEGASIIQKFFRIGAAIGAILAASAALRAHEIPNDVTLQMFVKPDGSTLHILVRVPLNAMRDMDYP